jgi:hypothetical protein
MLLSICQRSPVEQHTLTIDNPTEPLEPIYFDLLHELASREEWKIEKLLDTASATPGSGLSLDLSRRSQMDQRETTKILIFMRQRIRSFIQDWKKWRGQKRQLTFYVQARTPDDSAHESARHRLSHQWQEEAHNVGENREAAFKQWLHDSEAELRTETEIVRHLLADELNFLRMQANWLKPYLVPQTDTRRSDDPALVNVFNTATFEILLLVRMRAPRMDRETAALLPHKFAANLTRLETHALKGGHHE